MSDAGREAAPGGSRGENHDARDEDSTASVAIPERTADEQQRGEEERISFDDPLDADDRGLQILLQRWQRHIHHRAVDKGETGAEDGRSEDPFFG